MKHPSTQLLVLLLLVSVPQANVHAKQPAAFKISNYRGHEATVLGSIHVLRPSDPLPSTIEALYRSAAALAMELDMDDLDPVAVSATMLAAGQLPPGETIKDHLDKATLLRAEAALAELGLPLAALERMEPWLVALTLMQMKMLQLGIDPGAGATHREQ